MDPDAEGDPVRRTALLNLPVSFPSFTSTLSCSLLLFSCRTAPDERLLKAMAEKKESSRRVTVSAPVAKKKIYLSFDDGPNKGTPVLLNILDATRAPATLFLIGEQRYGSKAQALTWSRLQQHPGIELANHSYTHAHNRFVQYYSDSAGVVADFQRCQDSLQLPNRIARTPGRNIWRIGTLSVTDLNASKTAADGVQKAGFTLVGWDLEWHYKAPNLILRESADEMLQRMDSLLAHGLTLQKDHLVLLAHDQTFEDARDSAALCQLIRAIQARPDYQLDRISNYPGVVPAPQQAP
jgi:peptidoglycan-N-acetylglucosamine deacetylase